MAKKQSDKPSPTGRGQGEGKQPRAKEPSKRPIEQYDHDETRANNPPVGLVTPENDPDAGRKQYAYDPHLDPQLVWSGKAEHTSFEVPTVSLHVHERIDPKTIIQAVRKINGNGSGQSSVVSGQLRQKGLFEEPEENLPIRDAVDFYQHQHNWSNRLIAGDSLLVMNSLLEKEGMAGKVQMVYLDPPYGIRYGSNFQPFVNRRDVKDGRDEDLTQEPETIRAFRDTWELGIHSYLTYLRDRLLLARELLHESGSIFVQISDENLHYVRELLDEVFEGKNFVGLIPFQTTSLQTAGDIGSIADFLLWYARDAAHMKYRKLFLPKDPKATGGWGLNYLETENGDRRPLAKAERKGDSPIPPNARLYRFDNLTSQGATPSGTVNFEFDGKVFHPGANSHWKTTADGLSRLGLARRIEQSKNQIQYLRFFDDFAVQPLVNLWTDTTQAGFVDPKLFVVQTNAKVIERCLLMTTDPGDLVFDPTCGSGTTAYVAEQWGRRWITCDTSRVALTLAKQRLMTAAFDYYQLAHPESPPLPLGEGRGEGALGVKNGFTYKTVPHVTLKSIANNPEIKPGMTRAAIDAAIAKYADQETLYDQPLVDKSKARVTGPFTVEAVPAAAVLPLDEIGPPQPLDLDAQQTLPTVDPLDSQRRLETAVARSGETVRQSEWRDELLKTGIRGRSGQRIEFSRVEVLGGTRWLHADAETKAPLPGPPHKGRESEWCAL